jgi:hypothetical protein
VLALETDEELWGQVSKNALEHIREICGPETYRPALESIFPARVP